MSHGVVAPLVVLWIVWRERRRRQSLSARPSWWGLAILALGGGLFAGSVAFLVSVVGAVVCLAGFAFLRAWTFPLLLTVFMLPKLAVVYNQATLPLQLLASRMAATILTVSGVGVIREGNILLAIFANAARVAAAAWSPKPDSGTPHEVSRWLIFVLCLLTLALLRRAFSSVYNRFHA
jgi:exosortase